MPGLILHPHQFQFAYLGDEGSDANDIWVRKKRHVLETQYRLQYIQHL